MKEQYEEYCKYQCQYRDTIICDTKLKCCPFWNYILGVKKYE